MSRARLGMLLFAGLLTARPVAAQGTGPTRDFARPQAATVGGAVAPGWRGLGGFVAGDVRFGSMLGAFAPFVGAEAALLLGHRAMVGLRGAGLATSRVRVSPVPSGEVDTLRMGYGGLLVGYMTPVLPRLGISVDALLGAGTVGVDGVDADDHDAVFVFEPSATLDLAPVAAVRLGVGVTYRFVGGASRAGVPDSDLRGFVGLARVRVGRF